MLFLEHGPSGDAAVAQWQNRLNPLRRPLTVGCNLNRSVSHVIKNAGFEIAELEECYMPATPRLIGFLSRGMARRLT